MDGLVVVPSIHIISIYDYVKRYYNTCMVCGASYTERGKVEFVHIHNKNK